MVLSGLQGDVAKMSRGGAQHNRSARIGDLVNVEVEHLLGLKTGKPLVKLRAEGDNVVLVGQLDVASARRIALHLMEAAARAEYEHDLHGELVKAGFDMEMMGAIFQMVRAGEQTRHESGADGDASDE